MRYAVTYNKDFKHFEKVNEIIFNPINLTGWKTMCDFIEKSVRLDQQVIINISTLTEQDIKETYLPFLIELNNKRQIKVQIPFYLNDKLIPLLKKHNISFMFIGVARSREDFYEFYKKEPSDIYIAGGLLHELDEIKKIKQKYEIKIRVFPNINSEWIPDIGDTWIRPEDTRIYEKYIDVFEFINDQKTSTIFNIYFNRKWNGKVKDIIYNCNNDVFNDLISPHFGEIRATCHQKCYYESCNYCNQIMNMAKLIEKKMGK